MTKPFSVAEDLLYALCESPEDVISVYLDREGVQIHKQVAGLYQDTVTEFHVWDRDA